MQTALYIIWLLVPLIFFLLALWSKLEQGTKASKGKKVNKEPGDLFRQAIFVSGCSVITFLVDYLLTEKIAEILPAMVPIAFFQLMLLPIILYLGAITVGGSKPIRIKKAPRPSQHKRK